MPIDFKNLRPHYAITLTRWLENFDKHIDKVEDMYGIEFVRMWRLYLALCRIWFEMGMTRLYQFTFTNGIKEDTPLTRKYLYSK